MEQREASENITRKRSTGVYIVDSQLDVTLTNVFAVFGSVGNAFTYRRTKLGMDFRAEAHLLPTADHHHRLNTHVDFATHSPIRHSHQLVSILRVLLTDCDCGIVFNPIKNFSLN